MPAGWPARTTPGPSRPTAAAGGRPGCTVRVRTVSPSRTGISLTSPGRPCIRSDMVRARSTATQPSGRASPSDSVSTRAYSAASALSARRAAVIISKERPPSGSVMGRRGQRSSAGASALLLVRSAGRAGPPCAESAPGKGGLPWPILDETAHSRPLVLGREQRGEVQPLDLQASVQVDLEPGVDGLLGRTEGHGRAVGVLGHQVARHPVDLVVRDHLVHQANLQRLRRADEAAGEHDVLGPRGPDEPGQPLGPAGPGDDAEEYLGLAEAGALAGHPEVGAQRQVRPPPSAYPVTAATTGLPILATTVNAACSRRLSAAICAKLASAISLMSAPAAKTFSPP